MRKTCAYAVLILRLQNTIAIHDQQDDVYIYIYIYRQRASFTQLNFKSRLQTRER
jgi:hypothetical protein